MKKQPALTSKEKKAYEEWQQSCQIIYNGTGNLPEESIIQKQKRIERLLKPENFDAFIDYYFKIEGVEFAPLAWFHKEAIDNIFVKKRRKHLWEWHREAAKSVIADIFIPIHMLLDGSMKGLILASENQDKAKFLLKDMEAQLRYNRRIIHDFGDFGVTGSWLQGLFRIKKGYSFHAFGLGQNPAGVRDMFIRPNVGIVDDADSKLLAKNQKLVKEAVDWILGEFQGCLAKNDRYLIYVNNRVAKDGITAHLAGDLEESDKKDDTWAQVKCYLMQYADGSPAYPIDTTSAEELTNYYIKIGARPAWHEYYSLEDAVLKIIDYKYRNAMRQMFHKSIATGGKFNDDNLPWRKCLPLQEYDALVSYCDPAFGESDKGCFRAIVLVGLKGFKYDILWAWCRQDGSFAKAHFSIANKIREGQPVWFVPGLKVRQKVICEHWVESNALQKKILKTIYDELNRDLPYPWRPKYDMEAKADKLGRIEALEDIADNHDLGFNEEFRQDKDMITVRDQFKSFPDGFVDGPDAVEGAVSKLYRKRPKARSTTKATAGKYTKTQNRTLR